MTGGRRRHKPAADLKDLLVTGTANPELAAGVAKHLGIPLGKALVSKFSDGEIVVEINDNVRGKDVFVLQSTCAPTNDHLMEIMLMVDTAGTLTKTAEMLKSVARKSHRLLYAPGVVGSGNRAHRQLAAGRTCGGRHHSAVGSGQGLPQDPATDLRRPAGGNLQADFQGRLGLLAVCGLTPYDTV